MKFINFSFMEMTEKVYVEKPHKEYASKGMAGTALGLGIAGTALGLGLFNGNGLNLFGNNNAKSISNSGRTLTCEDKIELTSAFYQGRIVQINERFDDRQVLNGELFGLYKSQIDADFGLYKGQRDGFDVLQKEISDLKSHVAVTDAIQPYQMKLIKCEIDNAAKQADWNLCWRTRNMLQGTLIAPTTPTITGVPSACQCYNNCPSASSEA